MTAPDTEDAPLSQMPPRTVRVKLPHSEVCMHLQVAGRDHWVAPTDDRGAQIYEDTGRKLSAPVLLAEAGLDPDGHPQTLLRPTCTAFRVYYRDASNYKESTRVIVADSWDEESLRTNILPALEDGDFFTPCQVGLPDAHIRPFAQGDHPHHSLWDLSGPLVPNEHFTIVDAQPTVRLTWRQLCTRFSDPAESGFDPHDWPGAGTEADRPL
jgi:hypothetical protein